MNPNTERRNSKPNPDAQARRAVLDRLSREAERRMIAEDRAQILPRSKRERTWRHYWRALTLLLSALDAPDAAREFVADLTSILGFDVEEWTPLYDMELAEYLICTAIPISAADKNYKAMVKRMADCKRKGRDLTLKWQGETGNPLIIEYQAPYVVEEQNRRPEYKLPIAGAVRDIVRRAPVGASEKRLREAVQDVAADYIRRYDGAEKQIREKHEHSPESDFSRAATVALKAFQRFEADEQNGGHAAAVLAFREAFDPKIGHIIREAFAVENASKQAFFEDEFSDNINFDTDLENGPSGKFSGPPPSEIGHTGVMKSVGDLPQASPACDSLQSASGLEEESHGAETMPDEVRALEAFEAAGCANLEWFYLDDEAKQEGVYHRTTAEALTEDMAEIVADAERSGESLIVRVRGPVLQLDDCDAEAVELLKPFAFLVEETSAGNYQTWLAFKDGEDRAAARDRLFAQLKKIAPGVNYGAGGATRWPGSINFKPSRNAWRVRITYLDPGRTVTPSELDDAGLLAIPAPPAAEWAHAPLGKPGEWPDYAECVESMTFNGVCDRSRADWRFSCYALKRRIDPQDVAAKLREISSKAKEKGDPYINLTISKAMAHLGMEAA